MCTLPLALAHIWAKKNGEGINAGQAKQQYLKVTLQKQEVYA